MPHSSPNRLLYIEDDEGLARLLQRKLERLNLTVDISHTAELGLEMLQQHSYDLVILDYHLPGMSGLELLDVLANHEQVPPIIILTASGDEKIAVAALEKGAADYAVKDAGQNYLDLLPAILQAAYVRQNLQRENIRQQQELKEAKEKAEAANEAKSNFLATMSHEIRTPLNVVTGLTTVLAKTSLDPNQKKIVDTLSSNAALLLKLINDLLDISRIEGGHVALEATRFQFSEVLNDIRHMFEEQARQKNIAFNIQDQTAGRNFRGDRTRVQQIVMNLVSNAIKFTDTGEVEIVASSAPREDGKHCIELRVRDTGIGIAPEHLPVILNKFTQADETITRRYGGSGLGLSIAHSLAKMMDGDVQIESSPGKGSQFTAIICLEPCNACDAEETADVSRHPDAAESEEKEHILVVDDYAPNIMVASMMLEDLGYTTTSAESGAAALKILEARTKPFAAILMDVQMHHMDGLETTRRIRDLERRKGFTHPIIGVTAHALSGDRERCLNAGMDDYMSKPIHPDILASKLKTISEAL